ncbi:MAG: LPS assembly protein LptD [Aliishimia sp.]
MRALLLCLSLISVPWMAAAQTQEPAVLVADDVSVSRERVLTARGNVEVFQGDVSLTARAIIYDQGSGQLRFEGPLTLRDGEDVLILANAAELDPDLRNGILRSARLVIDQQLQLAAIQINRVDARYSQLYKAAVSSCRVCNDGRPPLWQIRAKRIVHDQEEQQLYFDRAQFWIRSIPIFYLPRLRLPDPTLERATGFLIPSIRTTSQLGSGIKVPYFIRLGDTRDLTLTPYLSGETQTLELRYRQAFAKGRIDFEGAFTRDNLIPDTDRYYLFGTGTFDLRNDFTLSFDIELSSDDAYLTQYGYSDKDRLDSEIAITRTRRDEYIHAGLIGYNTLISGEDNSTLPTLVLDGTYERRIFPTSIDGEFRLGVQAHAHHRSSNNTVSGEGRDVTRIHGELAYLKAWTLRGGMRIDSQLALNFDAFDTRQDDVFEGSETDVVPQAAIALRYPLSKTSADGAVQFLEPFVQLSFTGGNQANVANDESTRVEFDEGNLLSLSRFPEEDRREHTTALAFGLNWARYDPDGWESYVSFGQILRDTEVSDFSTTSGLGGLSSDFLFAGQLRTQAGLALGGRVLFDEVLDFSKAEFRGDWSNQSLTLGGSYLWLIEDALEDRTKAVSELTLDGAYRFDSRWTVSGNWRYDVEDDRTARAGLGLGYENECVALDFTVERSFESSTSVEPSTSFGFTVALRGFAAQNGTESYTKSCS